MIHTCLFKHQVVGTAKFCYFLNFINKVVGIKQFLSIQFKKEKVFQIIEIISVKKVLDAEKKLFEYIETSITLVGTDRTRILLFYR